MFDDPRSRTYLASGLLHGLACVAYPPIAIPVVLFAAMTRFAPARPLDLPARDGEDATSATSESTRDWSRRQWSLLGRYVLGVMIVGVLLVLLLIPGLLHHGLSQAMEYERQVTQLRSLDKAKDVIHAAFTTYVPGGSGWFAALGVIGLIGKQYERVRPYVFGALVVWIAYHFQETQPGYTLNLNSIFLSIYLGLLAGFFIILIDWKRDGRVFLLAGWIPSVLAGFVTAFSTANVAA